MTQWDPHVISHESLVSTDQAGSFWGESTPPLPAPQPRRIQGQGLCPKHVLSISIPSTVTNLSSVQKDVQRTVSEEEKGSRKGAGDSPRLTRSGWGTRKAYFPSGNQGVMSQAACRKLHFGLSPGTSHATAVLGESSSLATTMTLLKGPRKLCPWGGQETGEAGIHTISPLSKLFSLPAPPAENEKVPCGHQP